MATGAVQLASLGGIATWMDASVTHMLEGIVAPMVSNATAAIWPFVTVGMTISLMWYGWLIASGAVATPILTALRKVVNIVFIVSIAGAGGLYQTELIGVMLDLPSAVTSLFTNEPSTPAELLDAAANNGAEVSTRLQERAPGTWSDASRAFAFVLVAAVITIISALLSAVGIIVLVAVETGMGLVVVIGPLCILALLFDVTKQYFNKWVNQVIFYAIYGALFVVVFGVIMSMFGMLQQGLLDTTSADEINIFSMLTAIIIFISSAAFIMAQVPSIAERISGAGGRGGISIPFIGKIG